jgi:predicted dinucleotide-utilizing enzyme
MDKLFESISIMQKINRGSDRMKAWEDIGKQFYEKYQLQNLYQTLSQLPNDEAITFFKKGIAQSITATNATEETILQILPLVKADKESTEHLLQMHALYCAFFEKTAKEKIQKFNRSLNIQWALDIIAKFPKEENEVRLSTNLEEWIEKVADEDDRDQIELWAKQVLKGKITEEEFGDRVKKM